MISNIEKQKANREIQRVAWNRDLFEAVHALAQVATNNVLLGNISEVEEDLLSPLAELVVVSAIVEIVIVVISCDQDAMMFFLVVVVDVVRNEVRIVLLRLHLVELVSDAFFGGLRPNAGKGRVVVGVHHIPQPDHRVDLEILGGFDRARVFAVLVDDGAWKTVPEAVVAGVFAAGREDGAER